VEQVRLILGDCLEHLGEVPDGSIDLVLCDLPYGATRCPWDTPLPLGPLWAHYRRVLKPGAVAVLTAVQPFASALVASNPRWFRYEWVWVKNRATNPFCARTRPLRRHELILVFSAGAPAYRPQMGRGTPYRAFRARGGAVVGPSYGARPSRHRDNPEGERYPASALFFPCERGLHPAQKPVALMEYLVRTYTDPGGAVLDNAMGSGTTVVAALRAGRSAVGIERDPSFFEIASRRAASVLAGRGKWLQECH
jgi:hypothetical protein